MDLIAHPPYKIVEEMHGLSSKTYLCQKEQGMCVLKYAEDIHCLQHEIYALKRLAPLGIVPTLLDYNLEEGYLLMEQLQGRTLKPFAEEKIEHYEQAFRVLAKMHQATKQNAPNSYQPYKFLIRKYEEFKQGIDPLPQFLDEAMKKIAEIQQRYQEEVSFCHNDYHPDNIFVTDEGIKIIDFSSAEFGDPYFDVAKLLFHTPQAFHQKLFSAYLEKEPSSVEMEHLQDLQMVLYMVIFMVRYSGEEVEDFAENTDLKKYPTSSKEKNASALFALKTFRKHYAKH